MINLSDDILKNVVDIRLFGSCARNEGQSDSDIDVLLITKNRKNVIIPELTKKINNHFNSKISISLYSLNRINEMIELGHLFAWHLYNESKSLINKPNSLLICRRPNDYKNFLFDFNSINDILITIGEQIDKYPYNLIYEAGLLYLCARNIAISASWYSKNGLSFSRYSPFSLDIPNLQLFPLDKKVYEKLILSRQASMRGKVAPKISMSEISDSYFKVIKWSFNVEKCIKDEYIKISN